MFFKNCHHISRKQHVLMLQWFIFHTVYILILRWHDSLFYFNFYIHLRWYLVNLIILQVTFWKSKLLSILQAELHSTVSIVMLCPYSYCVHTHDIYVVSIFVLGPHSYDVSIMLWCIPFLFIISQHTNLMIWPFWQNAFVLHVYEIMQSVIQYYYRQDITCKTF